MVRCSVTILKGTFTDMIISEEMNQANTYILALTYTMGNFAFIAHPLIIITGGFMGRAFSNN